MISEQISITQTNVHKQLNAAASEREQLSDIKEDKVSGPSNIASPSLTIISDLCGSYH